MTHQPKITNADGLILRDIDGQRYRLTLTPIPEPPEPEPDLITLYPRGTEFESPEPGHPWIVLGANSTEVLWLARTTPSQGSVKATFNRSHLAAKSVLSRVLSRPDTPLRPMSDLPDGDHDRVLVAYGNGARTWLRFSFRGDDELNNRKGYWLASDFPGGAA